MTKGELETKLRSGWLFRDLLDFGPGEEDFTICRAERFLPGDDVIYIPAAELNMLPMDRLVTGTEIDEIMGPAARAMILQRSAREMLQPPKGYFTFAVGSIRIQRMCCAGPERMRQIVQIHGFPNDGAETRQI